MLLVVTIERVPATGVKVVICSGKAAHRHGNWIRFDWRVIERRGTENRIPSDNRLRIAIHESCNGVGK